MAGPSVFHSVPLHSLSPSLPAPPPAGPPEVKPEETQPQAKGSWREGDEVRLVCFARGFPEPKLSWSQLGGSVRDPSPSTPNPLGATQAPSPNLFPHPSKHCVPSTSWGTGHFHLCPHPQPLVPWAWPDPSLHSQQSRPLEGKAG